MQYFDEWGTAIPRPAIPHQRIIRDIILNWYLRTGFHTYEALPEPGIWIELDDDDGNSNMFERVPDVGFVLPGYDKVTVAIEVLKSGSYTRTELLSKREEYYKYGMAELFIYNYMSGSWKEVRFNQGQIELSGSYLPSEVLGIHPSELLRLPDYPPEAFPLLPNK